MEFTVEYYSNMGRYGPGVSVANTYPDLAMYKQSLKMSKQNKQTLDLMKSIYEFFLWKNLAKQFQ